MSFIASKTSLSSIRVSCVDCRWDLSPFDAVILSLLCSHHPQSSCQDIPVYLPDASPNVSREEEEVGAGYSWHATRCVALVYSSFNGSRRVHNYCALSCFASVYTLADYLWHELYSYSHDQSSGLLNQLHASWGVIATFELSLLLCTVVHVVLNVPLTGCKTMCLRASLVLSCFKVVFSQKYIFLICMLSLQTPHRLLSLKVIVSLIFVYRDVTGCDFCYHTCSILKTEWLLKCHRKPRSYYSARHKFLISFFLHQDAMLGGKDDIVLTLWSLSLIQACTLSVTIIIEMHVHQWGTFKMVTVSFCLCLRWSNRLLSNLSSACLSWRSWKDSLLLCCVRPSLLWRMYGNRYVM